jgi:hypothetical protein
MVHNEGNRSLGSVENDAERRMKNHLLVTILADRKERHFALLLDGKFVREFNDPQEFKGSGDCIMFQTHQASSMKIAKIKIARWDGKLPKAESSGSGAIEQDTLVFVNGDAMSGAVRSIATGNVKFETSYAMMDVPLERIARMRFANKLDLAPPVVTAATNTAKGAAVTVMPAEPLAVGSLVINGPVMANGQMMITASGRMRSSSKTVAEPAAPVMVYPPGSTRCFFNDQDAVTLKLDKIADDGVAGAAQGIGALKLPLGALTRLEFNPGAKRANAEADNDEL